MPAPSPVQFALAFAANADAEYRDVVPVTNPDAERASLGLGFPPLTFQPVVAGGKPPWGKDMNGILYMISSHTVYQQSGQPYKYNAAFAAAISGYAVGTILGMADGSGLWINRTANNQTDPDNSGAGWVPLYCYGALDLPVTGGLVTLTRAQARKRMIVLRGTLASNLQLTVPVLPGVAGDKFQEWLVVNQTTGAFTVVVKTPDGTGIQIPPGGSSAPTGVYTDGINVYPTVAPVNLPIDQAPTPGTIVQRTNNGYVTATYFNQTSGLENLAAAAIYFDIGDGYHRKIAPINLAAQMALSWFSGQVTAGQVPFSAVQQYAAALFSSPAFTGVPTAPTAAPGTNSAQIATTAFVTGAASIGYGQTWTNPGRDKNLTYVNGMARPIMVAVSINVTAGGGNVNVVVGGVSVSNTSNGSSADNEIVHTFVVPPGQSYRVNGTGSRTNVSRWAELV